MKRTPTRPQRSGTLVLVGGNEDKRGEMQVLRHAVEVAGATTVTVVPTASDYPWERADEYRRAFSALGVAEVLVADIRSRADAELAETAELARRPQLVFFTGGDQVRLVEILAGTHFLDEVRAAFIRGTTLAGTSAGAAAAGEVTIFHGDGAGHAKGTVRHSPGLSFIDGLVVDTHFDTRCRLARLAQFLCSGGGLKGFGLAEDTALVVRARRPGRGGRRRCGHRGGRVGGRRHQLRHRDRRRPADRDRARPRLSRPGHHLRSHPLAGRGPARAPDRRCDAHSRKDDSAP